ncbi:MAG: D-alanyl-D-alanine carboxypeptidase family protein [Eubacteriales bacterium]|jgi:LAS superfamily LD-carboxypeptidase LdcB
MNQNEKRPGRIYPGARCGRGDVANQRRKSASGRPRHPKIHPIEAARRKKERKLIATAAAVFILFLSIIIALVARACTPKENTGDFIVIMESKRTIPYTDIVRGGVVYLNATELAYFCRMTLSGSYDKLKLTSNSGDSAVFVPGKSTAKVNGADIAMPAPAILDGNELWLPCDFIISTFRGVNVTIDREKNKITVTREEAEGSKPEKPVYVDVTFSVEKSNLHDRILEMIGSYEFLTDVSAVLAYLNPADSKYLMLVNQTNPLGQDYVPSPLETLDTNITLYGNEIRLEKYARRALEAMFAELRAAGFDNVYVSSGYRSYNTQETLFRYYVQEEMDKGSLTKAEAEERVKKYSAPPGYSEHQSGLCVDLIVEGMKELDNSFASYPVYKWLVENSYKFGFVLRYPEGKTDITGYVYEPWHYRFVGQYYAAAMHETGTCLEEYLETTKNH